MADPVTMAGVGIGSTVASTFFGAMGAGQSAQAQAGMYQYQSGMALLNKRIAEQNADYTREVGEVTAQREGMKTRAEIGTTKATQAGRGLDINVGSPADVRASEAELGEHNQAVIRSDFAKKAYGFEVEAAKETAQAGMYQTAAAQSRRAGSLNMLSSIIGGASSVASKWSQASTAGIGSSSGYGPGTSGYQSWMGSYD